jgi:hypothetical protein
MKSPKRILVALVAFLLCMTTFLPLASAEIIFMPQSSQLIDLAEVSADPQGGGSMKATARIYCYDAADNLGFSYIRLQELRDGSWVTVKSVTSKYTSNARTYVYSFTYYGTTGLDYRAQAGFYAKDYAVTETCSSTSAVRTCY